MGSIEDSLVFQAPGPALEPALPASSRGPAEPCEPAAVALGGGRRPVGGAVPPIASAIAPVSSWEEFPCCGRRLELLPGQSAAESSFLLWVHRNLTRRSMRRPGGISPRTETASLEEPGRLLAPAAGRPDGLGPGMWLDEVPAVREGARWRMCRSGPLVGKSCRPCREAPRLAGWLRRRG